jgi:hypothetical protein
MTHWYAACIRLLGAAAVENHLIALTLQQRVGLWKAKLLAGGVNQATLTSSTAAAPDPPASAELGFVYFRLLDLSEAARAAQFVPAINADGESDPPMYALF